MSSIIHLHEQDNVGVSKAALPAGITLIENNLTLRADIPAMHKVALMPIAKGEAILKYGQVIGFASTDIAAGDHVHTHNCVMGDLEKDYGFCRNAVPTEFVAPEQRATFKGYRRANGKVGTRNYIGILTTVNCSATVARAIAQHFTFSGELKSFPNIDGVVAFTHETGCGMRSDGEGYETLRRTFDGYARHPNFGGVMMVGLGCETMQVQRVMEESGLADTKTFFAYTIQEVGGTRIAIEKGIETLRAMLPLVNEARREPVPASELTLAVQCGGSDAFSGITANPALGIAGDILVRHGGTVIYSETPEIFGAEHLLTQRAATPELAEKLLERIRWWEDYTERNGFELNNNPSPGNKVGGLTTILEKSLGAQAKSGSTQMTGVYLYAEEVKEKGLVFMDSPGFDPVSVTGQVASGANVVCFTTGRGSAFGFKPVPSIKLASNSQLFERMKEDVDINCGGILDGEYTLQECGEKIFADVLAVASGESTKSELLGYGDNEFNPWKIGAVV
ncbi:UxaA family hydrolase [Cellvibrio sp. PSBB006]|uniref:UxaA family hydrolase n=1 Tax=Cellvibrio sp. PSBB006 TaxID=1987723 RepID=UPI000B3B32BE|nr:altronate dehydratase family protein [Cellvibrio sp. PSBB006]ARU27995.1 galactonate dehydratase [Cellvibrio sp. PSBB006]